MKRKLRLKPPVIKFLKIIGCVLGCIFVLILGAFIFYKVQTNPLKELGYSDKAIYQILTKFKKKDVLEIGKNKTLNKAFESVDYKDENFHNYTKIKYQNHDKLIKNINELIKKGYSNDDISMILAHGTSSDVEEFAKRDKVRYLEEFYTIDYAKIKYYDRYLDYMDKSREDEETSVLVVNLGMDKEDYEDPVEVTEFSYDMLINKHRMLKHDFVPKDLVSIGLDYASDKGLKANKTALIAAEQMIDDAEKEGYQLVINSSYRSYEDQEEIQNTYKNLYGENYVTNYVLRPGFSEHQTGLSFDIGSRVSNVFLQSKEYNWIVDNCYKYGFIYRFKKEYEGVTGIKHEAWHYRYVGKDIAKYIYENDITLEEYYAKFLDK